MDEEGNIPNIIHGALNNDIREVEAAIQFDPKSILETQGGSRLTALHISVSLGNLTMVQFLSRQRGCDLSAKDAQGRDAIDLALVVGHPEIIEHLMKLRAHQIGLDADEKPQGNVFPFKPS